MSWGEEVELLSEPITQGGHIQLPKEDLSQHYLYIHTLKKYITHFIELSGSSLVKTHVGLYSPKPSSGKFYVWICYSQIPCKGLNKHGGSLQS